MSKDLNKVLLIGRLGKDPEMKYTNTGVAFCTFSLATSESYKGENNTVVEKTEWHNIVAWRKLAEICSQYLKKGSKIYAEGKISTSTYEKEGEKKYSTRIILTEMIMLDTKGGSGHSASTSVKDKVADQDYSADPVSDDEPPF
ncbi:single-stranded DNA-binding protein [soil metagenome]